MASDAMKTWGHCTTCGVQLNKQTPAHLDLLTCVKALQTVLSRQREAASTLAFEVSTQFLAVLEQLAAHPDAGIVYHTWQIDPETQKQTLSQVKTAQVAGVFSAILKRYHEMGDWSPLAALRNRIAELEAELATRPPAAPLPGPPGS